LCKSPQLNQSLVVSLKTTNKDKGNNMNIFEQASRENTTFNSNRGTLTVTDLWKLPLTGVTKVSLNSIYQNLQAKVTQLNATKSLVVQASPESATLDLQIKLVEHIFSTLTKEEQDRQDIMKTKEELNRKINLLAIKQDKKESKKSEKELLADIEQLKQQL